MSDEKTDQQIREEKTAAATEAATKPATSADERIIAALKRERAGLVVQGKTDRIAEVDEQLKHYGYTPESKADESTARKQPPQGRSAKPQHTGN